MATRISPALLKVIGDHAAEVKTLVNERPDWERSAKKFDALYKRMSDPGDPVWGEKTFAKLKEAYFSQRDKDKGMSNITLRTVAAMPAALKNDTKKIFLQTAEACCFFNAAHKVNFDAEELPAGFDEVKMKPGKGRGVSTYVEPLPALYKKTSLSFDYWMPKIIEWTEEIRSKKLESWKGESILQHESCTDFMRVSLLFLSDPAQNVPVAKAEERAALLQLFGEEFTWIKKSAKREDILLNSSKLKKSFAELEAQLKLKIPLEAWSRILQSSFVKTLMK